MTIFEIVRKGAGFDGTREISLQGDVGVLGRGGGI
jgi:hypothetical protein